MYFKKFMKRIPYFIKKSTEKKRIPALGFFHKLLLFPLVCFYTFAQAFSLLFLSSYRSFHFEAKRHRNGTYKHSYHKHLQLKESVQAYALCFGLAIIALIYIADFSAVTFYRTPWFTKSASAAVKTWDGGGIDNNWNTPENWDLNTAPLTTDTVVFDGTTSSKSVTINTAVTIAGITIDSDYGGVITQAATLAVGTSGFVQNGGTFTGATQSISDTGPLTLNTGSTFTSTSGTLTLSGDLTVQSGVTFDDNGGTLEFSGTSNTGADVNTSLTLNNIIVHKTTSLRRVTIATGDTLVAEGVLTLTDGAVYTGTIEAQTTINNTGADDFDGGDGIIHWTGTSTQTITLAESGDFLPGLILDNPNATIQGTMGFQGDVTLNAGEIDSDTYSSMRFYKDLTLNVGGTYTAAETTLLGENWDNNGGTFDANEGTVVLAQFSTQTHNNHVITGDNTFYNFTRDYSDYTGYIQFGAGDTQTFTREAVIGLGVSSTDGITRSTRLPVYSTSSGTPAELHFDGDVLFFDAALTDINNTSAEFDCRLRCVDISGNTNIDFSESIEIYVSEISSETSEDGDTATFTVYLTSRPQNDVTIPVVSSDTSEGTVSTALLTFTSANWETEQTVTVTGQNDADNDGLVSYTIQLGSTSSTDTRFNGINPDDVAVKNQDDDTATTAFEFEQISDFDEEDIKDTTSTTIGAFYPWGNGLVSFYHDMDDYNNSIYIDLTASKIKPGCKIDIGGTVYTFVQVVDEATLGYSAELTRDNILPLDIYDELALLDGEITVDSITCMENQDGTVKLNDDFINVEQFVDTEIYAKTADATREHIFFPNAADNTVNILDVATSTLITTAVGNDPRGIALDSSRNNLWIANYDDDTITVVDADTGSYHFGTIGASTFAASNMPITVGYDVAHDAIWVGSYFDDTLLQYDPSDGSLDTTLDPDAAINAITYDSTHEDIWATWNYYGYMVKVHDTAFANGTVTDSKYPLPIIYEWADETIYDSTRDMLWTVDGALLSAVEIGFLTAVRTSDGEPMGLYEVGQHPLDVQVNTARNEIWTVQDEEGSFSIVDPTNGRLKKEKSNTVEYADSLIFDADGAAWVGDTWNQTLDKVIPDGVPADTYFTFSSNATSQLDVSAKTSIDAATVTETLNGQHAYYSVSFDGGDSYKVWGSWRAIASNKNSDHGGTEGNWYYRDNASVWTAASPNNKSAAISAAVAAGANNQMDSTEMSALVNTDWAASGGFDAGVTATLDLAATLYTDDPFDTPTVGKVAFTFDGGGGPANTAPTAASVTASQVADDSGDVSFSFQADDADDDDTVEALVEYNIGAGWEKATISTTDDNTTATFGDPEIDNTNAYPIGEAAGYILTSSGANTVSSIWNSMTDEPAADVPDALIRITPYDGTDIGTAVESAAFALDNTAAPIDETNTAPTFSGSLSSVSFFAGDTVANVFDLDSYFSDAEDPILSYSVTGNTDITITVSNGEVTMTSSEDYIGTEEVYFVATDSGSLTAQSNAVLVSVTEPDDDSDSEIVHYSTGTNKGRGIIRLFNQDHLLMASWEAFHVGGVLPRLAEIKNDIYVFAVKKRSGSSVRVYDTLGTLITSKRLSPKLHWRRMAVGNLNTTKNTEEVVVSSKRGSSIYLKAYSFNIEDNKFHLLKRSMYKYIRRDYRLKIRNKKIIAIINGKGKEVYRWEPFK